jgi:DNA-binding transcriptional ArsR family regulator
MNKSTTHSRLSSRSALLLADQHAAELADLFRLLGDPTRLRIVLTCLDAPTSVGEIADRLDLSASLVSHHLRLLRAARVVRAERHGKQVFYAAADEHVRRVVVDMLEHVAEPQDEDA